MLRDARPRGLLRDAPQHEAQSGSGVTQANCSPTISAGGWRDLHVDGIVAGIPYLPVEGQEFGKLEITRGHPPHPRLHATAAIAGHLVTAITGRDILFDQLLAEFLDLVLIVHALPIPD